MWRLRGIPVNIDLSPDATTTAEEIQAWHADILNGLSGHWNISLFHYRNHGADYGRVLAGVQVPPDERPQLKHSLDQLGYPYWDETDNPAYRSFLSSDASSKPPTNISRKASAARGE